jgi:S-(hydroxymethyl)glutathione dehydrogenase/alcohol dehydrogenase
MSGDLDLETMISARRPLDEVESALADLEAGGALRQLLLP